MVCLPPSTPQEYCLCKNIYANHARMMRHRRKHITPNTQHTHWTYYSKVLNSSMTRCCCLIDCVCNRVGQIQGRNWPPPSSGHWSGPKMSQKSFRGVTQESLHRNLGFLELLWVLQYYSWVIGSWLVSHFESATFSPLFVFFKEKRKVLWHVLFSVSVLESPLTAVWTTPSFASLLSKNNKTWIFLNNGKSVARECCFIRSYELGASRNGQFWWRK